MHARRNTRTHAHTEVEATGHSRNKLGTEEEETGMDADRYAQKPSLHYHALKWKSEVSRTDDTIL